MKKVLIAGVLAAALAFAVSASAALVPGVYDPGNTGCVKATFIKKTKTLHLEKNCPTATNASAGAEVTGVSGQTFQSASFTLASASQCQGGSPRFDVVAGGTTYFLGCNNVTPTINSDGSATYTFTPQSLTAAAMPVPTGSISAVDVLVDVQGTADLTRITFNGMLEKPVQPMVQCKHGGWKDGHWKNQGQCVSHFAKAKHSKTHHR